MTTCIKNFENDKGFIELLKIRPVYLGNYFLVANINVNIVYLLRKMYEVDNKNKYEQIFSNGYTT